ncbi:hypothetical protein FLGE108171_10340 [Flavobacterium gelidilacus]|uniref:hypothetical protein n=1 Tax=Flavobacterium gelidilacus TaxID=206041 RepID=UPI0012FA82DC|nr:hypothetical protein [Flavobacterium gelidilacus]
MCKNYFLLAFAFLFLTSNAQEQDNHQVIIKSINDYYSLATENIHLHFNKSSYLSNETIWFKGYIIDKKSNGLNYETTNIYVRILDQNKNEIVSKLFLANSGIIIGDLKLDNKFTSGTYYIHTYTNFMNNFEEDESSIFPIEIINTKDKSSINNNNTIDKESIIVTVEGDKLLFQCDNTVGVQIKNCSGEGIKANNIKVFDSKNNMVNQFSTNEQGYGKFDLLKTKNEQYKIVVEQNETTVEKNLPLVISEGITMSVNNYSDDNNFLIKVKTNSYTFEKIKDVNFTLVIQKNNQVALADFYFENPTKDIILEKSNLFKGLNIIRIVDQNNNLFCERIIYNHVENNSKIILEKSKINNDSLLIKGHLKNKIANFSISILPKETTSSFESNAITSQLNFNNYLTSKIENYSYYFKDFNRNKQFELDLVLLNQNNIKYSWKDIVTKKPTIKYPFDIGLTIEGSSVGDIKNKENYNVLLSSNINRINLQTSLDNKNNFKFENIVAIDSTSFFISLLKNNSKYENINLNTKVSNNENKFLKPISNNFFKCSTNKYIALAEYNSDYPYVETTNQLNEVVLTESVDEKFLYTENYENRTGTTGMKIDDSTAQQYQDVLSYISTQGFDVKIDPRTNKVVIAAKTANSFQGSLVPVIYLDGSPLSTFEVLLNLSLKDIEEIYLNKRGYGQGMTAASGTIRIYTKKRFGTTKEASKNSKTFLVKNGFQKEISFKNPQYMSYTNLSFRKHGTIYWIPSIYTDENGDFEFKIPTLDQKSILLNVQGIDNEGNFYYENIEIELN